MSQAFTPISSLALYSGSAHAVLSRTMLMTGLLTDQCVALNVRRLIDMRKCVTKQRRRSCMTSGSARRTPCAQCATDVNS